MKILHTADIHLREHQDERWQTLEKLIEIGNREKIQLFAISGDLFDKNIDSEELRPHIREIFSKNSFKILIIPGNHDHGSYRGGLFFGDNAIILNDMGKPFDCENVRFIGLPFEHLDLEGILNKIRRLRELLRGDKTNILLYHGELLDAFYSRGDFGEEGIDRYMPLKLSYMSDLDIDYVLAGHFHTNFDVRQLENGGYFVYPGSPISITMRETGQRKINIFEIGVPPKGYLVDTPHFEEVLVQLDPFSGEEPLELVRLHLKKLHPKAKVVLSVTGYVNSKEIQRTETELVNRIREISSDKCVKKNYEFKDIQTALENDLFKTFLEKLKTAGYESKKSQLLQNIAIKAMMGAEV